LFAYVAGDAQVDDGKILDWVGIRAEPPDDSEATPFVHILADLGELGGELG
jgi:hypothetical protein